jgi:hypothetical protein
MTCYTLVHELSREQPKTTKEQLIIATRHASGEEVVGVAFMLANAGVATNSGRAAPTKATVKGARKGTKGGKKGQKRWPCRIAILASNGNEDEEADNTGEKFLVAAERDFKLQTWSPKNHSEKLLEATYPHHPFPAKHKLKDCTTIIKNSWRRGLSPEAVKQEGPKREECGTHSWGSRIYDNL